MSFAPHSNTDVQHQIRMGMSPTPLGLILGEFRHRDTGAFFEYGERREFPEDFHPELPHVIYTIDGPRLALVLKTVAKVLTGEGMESWQIKGRAYPTDWVRD